MIEKSLLTGRELVAGKPVGPCSSHNGLRTVLDSANSGATHGGLGGESLHFVNEIGSYLGPRRIG